MSEIKRRSKPKFLRPNYGRKERKRVKGNWRKPRGIDNKKRIYKKFMGSCPAIGFRSPKAIRCMHPVGMQEALVHNPAELDAAEGKVVRIGGSVGGLKRKLIAEKAKAKGLRILNL